MHSNDSLSFHNMDNDQIICYSKHTEDQTNVILVVVNLDYRYKQSGWVDLSLEELGLDPAEPYKVKDLLTDATYQWQGERNYVELNPLVMPAHILRISRQAKRESDFDYYL